MHWGVYLYQAEASVFFLVAVCREPSQSWLHVHANSTGLWRLLATRIRGCDQFRTDILAHLRFKRIVSCWFSNRCMCLKPASMVILSRPNEGLATMQCKLPHVVLILIQSVGHHSELDIPSLPMQDKKHFLYKNILSKTIEVPSAP